MSTAEQCRSFIYRAIVVLVIIACVGSLLFSIFSEYLARFPTETF